MLYMTYDMHMPIFNVTFLCNIGHCLGDRIQQQKSKLTTILSESREKNLQDEEMFKEEHQQQLLKVRLTEKVLENGIKL